MDDIRSLSSLSERSDSDQRVDVHVYIVPRELWQEHLCSAVNQVISDTVSAGFIRVLPETSIYNLRSELESQLDYDILPVNYVFLRCVGRCFTRLRPKQEHTLKVKHFIPPQTYAPELFLLESSGDVLSATSQGSVDSHSRLTQYNIKSSGSSELSGHRTLPPINTVNHQTTQTGNEGWVQQQPSESTRTAGHVTARNKLTDSRDNRDFELERVHWSSQSPDPDITNSNNKSTQFPDPSTGVTGVNGVNGINGLRPESLPMLIELNDSFDVGRKNNFNAQRQIQRTAHDSKELERQRHENILRQQKEEDERKAEELERQRRLEEEEIEEEHNTRRKMEDERNRQIAEGQRRKQQQQQQQLKEEEERRREEERRKQEEIDRQKEIKRLEEAKRFEEERNKEQQRREQELEKKRLDEEKRKNEEQKQREIDKRKQEEIQRKRELEQTKLEKSATEKQQKEAEKVALLKELSELRASRQNKEHEREELMKHAKQLHNKTRSGRNHSRDLWKKKYFVEKRKTSPLEEQARKLRHELELIHKRILSHMEKVKDGGTYNITGGPSQQNNLRIQTVRLQQEIDVIQRRIGDINMKLTAEIKLRNQVEQELKALKSELAQQRTKIRALQVVEPADRHPYDHIHTHSSAATQEKSVA